MTDKQKIKAEIERYKKLIGDPILSDNDLIIGERNACNHILKIIDSLPEEPVSESLEEAAWMYYDKNKPMLPPEFALQRELVGFFKAGAHWQKEKFVAWLTKESDFLI